MQCSSLEIFLFSVFHPFFQFYALYPLCCLQFLRVHRVHFPSEVKCYFLHKDFCGASYPFSQLGISSLCILRLCSTVTLIMIYCKSMYIAPNNYLRSRTLFHISLSPMSSTQLAVYTMCHKLLVT